jgi:hypothetical protein
MLDVAVLPMPLSHFREHVAVVPEVPDTGQVPVVKLGLHGGQLVPDIVALVALVQLVASVAVDPLYTHDNPLKLALGT